MQYLSSLCFKYFAINLVRLRHYLNSRRLSCQTPPPNRGFRGSRALDFHQIWSKSIEKKSHILSKFLVQKKFSIPYNILRAQNILSKKVYHFWLKIRLFGESSRVSFFTNTCHGNEKQKSQNIDDVIASRKNFGRRLPVIFYRSKLFHQGKHDFVSEKSQKSWFFRHFGHFFFFFSKKMFFPNFSKSIPIFQKMSDRFSCMKNSILFGKVSEHY